MMLFSTVHGICIGKIVNLLKYSSFVYLNLSIIFSLFKNFTSLINLLHFHTNTMLLIT
ncbi:hypothetical protein WN943_009611 [Citrus x changshan-huyou]